MKTVLCTIFISLALQASLWAQEKLPELIQNDEEDTAIIQDRLKRAFRLRKEENIDLSAVIFNQSLSASKAINYPWDIAYTLVEKATIELTKGNIINAFTLIERAEKNHRKISNGDSKLQALIDNAKGNCFDHIGYYDSALVYYLKAIAWSERLSDTLPIGYYNNAGYIMQKVGNYTKADYYFNKAAERLRKNRRDSLVLAHILINRAGAYFQDKNDSSLNKAIYFTEQALAIARKYQAVKIEAHALINIATLMMEGNDSDRTKSLLYLKAAEKIVGSTNVDQIHLYTNFAYTYFDLKQYKIADEYLEKALGIAKTIDSKDRLLSVYTALEYGQRTRGNFEEAYRYADIKELLKDSLGMERNALKVNYLQYQYESSQRDNDLIKKNLQIAQQAVTLQRRNMIIISLLGGTCTLCALFYFYFRYRRKIERQKMKFVTWSAAVEAEEKERARLARELHDNIGGSLSTVKMWFGTLQKKAHDEHRERDFEEAMQLLDQTLNDLRDTAHHLMPEVLTRFGLAQTVRIYCENIQKAGELEVEYNYFGFVGEMDKKLDLVIYRIIQELIQNVIKHANASFLLVQLSRHDDNLSVTIEDNGLGMTEIEEMNGMGLQNIKMSINNLKGHFNIHSEKGHGTNIYFEINVAKS